MREIKFRAWNIATKTMIDLKKITPLALNMDTDGLFIPFSDGLPLMQYTGLLDKNGKEIYEGDIYIDNEEKMLEVKWDINCFNIPRISWGLKIIGNIYETPELLDKK